MNILELFRLTRWIDREIITEQVQHKYQVLADILQQNQNVHQQKQPFEAQKDDLIATIKSVPLLQLTEHQLNFLSQLDIAQAVGKEGVEQLEDILYKNALDLATATQKIQRICQQIAEGVTKSNQIKAGLDGCVSEEEYEPSDEVLMRVTFTGNASMSNVTNFKDWGEAWHTIGRGITMAHNSSPEAMKIVGATKGSVILEMLMNPEIAETFGAILFFIMEFREKHLNIEIKTRELLNLEIKTEILEAIKEDVESKRTAAIDDVSTKVIDMIKQSNSSEDFDGEKTKTLTLSVKNLFDFVEKGGVIDLVPNENEEESEDGQISKNGELRITAQKIRQLEHNITALLEHHYSKDE